MRERIFSVLACGLLLMFIGGCATDSYYTDRPSSLSGIPGIFHRVEKGQTLWSVARAYGVDLDELAKVNRIYDAGSIKAGQLIFIPRAKAGSGAQSFSQSSSGADEGFIWPLKGNVISAFKQNNNNIINRGIDIQAPFGCDVIASRSGIVTFYDQQLKGLGKTIIIDHGNDFLTVYARNSDVFVGPGDKVVQGKVIAKVGSAGRDKASFLHFEIRKSSIAQNPYYYLP